MKRIPVIIMVLALFAAFALKAAAADKDTEKKDDQYYPELKNDDDMRVIQSKKNMLSSGITYGAWITPVFIYSQAPHNELTSQVTTYRLWFKTYLWDNSFLYVRGKDTYTAIVKHRGSASAKNRNILDLDLGYISLSSDRKDVDFTVGRKYFLIGSGLVLDGRGDGAELNYYSKYLNIKAIGAYTGFLVKDDNPYGLSDRDISTGARRLFAGGVLSTSWFNQTLYVLGIDQIDYGRQYYNKQKALGSMLIGFDEGLRYYSKLSHYQSHYYGAGLEGIITSGLSYSGEFIMEQGKSYLSGYSVTKSIAAYAGIFKVNYYINVKLKPVISAQYAFGSGDQNRNDYRLPDGNTWGKDRGFLYFGTFVGGYALKPVLANMHVISGTASFAPFSWSDKYNVKNMTVVVKYNYYLKYKTYAAINNGLDATRPNKHIGQGVDLSLRWLVFSDFSAFLNYGLFIPGGAFGYQYDYFSKVWTYSSTAKRHFIMGGFNISF